MSIRANTDHDKKTGVPTRKTIPSCVPFNISRGSSLSLLKFSVSVSMPGINIKNIIITIAINCIVSVIITPDNPAIAV